MSVSTVIEHGDEQRIERAIAALRVWLRERDRPLTVALISGGLSAEDRFYLAHSPVDQLSVTALTATLDALGLRHTVLDPSDQFFLRSLMSFDVALSNLHGPFGEDGRLQGVLDWLPTPVSGSTVAACAVAADKILCKRVMSGLGVPTPAGHVWTPAVPVEWRGRVVMVKPSLGGSSLGMSLVRESDALELALAQAWSVDPSPVLIEDYIPGTPVTVGMLELPDGVLMFPPVATIVHNADFYDAATKLGARTPVSLRRADFPAAVLDALAFHAGRLWEGLGCHGAVRMDFVVTPDGEVYGLEVNTTPGLSYESNYVIGARLCGLNLPEVVLAMLWEAVTRPPYDVPLPCPSFEVSVPRSASTT